MDNFNLGAVVLLFLYTLVDPSDHYKIEYIYNTYHNDMIKLAKSKLKRLGHPNYDLDAEDAVQNAFVKITRYIKNVDISVNHNELKAYVLTTVANEVYNLKKEYKFCDDIDEYAEQLQDDEFISSIQINERYEKVIQVIKKMDDRYSMTLLFRFRDDMSVSEISDYMGLPEKTVYTRLERGKRLLLKLLEGRLD